MSPSHRRAEITAEIRFWWRDAVPQDVRDRLGEGAWEHEARVDTYALSGPRIGLKQRGADGPVELKMLLDGAIALSASALPASSLCAQLWAKLPAESLPLPDIRRVRIEKQRHLGFWRADERRVEQTERSRANFQCEIGMIRIEGARWATLCLEAAGSFDEAPAILAMAWQELALPQSVHTGEALSYPALLDRLF